MYLGLVFCIARWPPPCRTPAGAYSFARTAMGPWGGFVTGLCENVEYVLTPAVIVVVSRDLSGCRFRNTAAWLPAYWVSGYAVFVALNIAASSSPSG